MKLKFSILLVFLYCFSVSSIFGQFVIKGRVTDANNGDPIPFASVGLVGVSQGARTNFQGEFNLNSKFTADSLFTSFVGYKKRIKKITRGLAFQEINFQIEPSTLEMAEVKVYSGENPAYRILRGVLQHKESNDRSKLIAYEYDSYTKMELDVDNISEKFKERRVMKDIAQAIKKFEEMAGEDGKLIIPTYLSESIGKFYYLENPQRKKEVIQKTNIKGVGVSDGSFISQLVGGNLVASYNSKNHKIYQYTQYPTTIRRCMKYIASKEPFRDSEKRWQLIEVDLDKNLIDYVGE